MMSENQESSLNGNDSLAVKQNETRYAIYFTLPKDDPLYQLASVWLGYDAYSGKDTPLLEKKMFQLDQQSLKDAVTNPQRYGFHGTLKAPFCLHPDKTVDNLKASLEDFSKQALAFNCKPLKIKKVGGFFALVPARESRRLNQLASDCVQEFDEYRAPLTKAERVGRTTKSLTAAQLKLLDEWGYPYVMDEFKFHMTLTNTLNEDQSVVVKQRLRELFRTFLGNELKIDHIALFKQENKQARFTLLEQYELRG